MNKLEPAQIKAKILSKYKTLTSFSLEIGISIQGVSDTIYGRQHHSKVAIALQEDFGILPEQLPLPPAEMRVKQ